MRKPFDSAELAALVAAYRAEVVIDTARQTAGWTALFLGLTVGAAALGAGVGSKESIWSRREATSAS